MKTNPNDPAQRYEGGGLPGTTGLTKREHFAAMAMQGISSLESWHRAGPSSIRQKAELSVAHADALIEALNKEAKS